jgi:hypothetical protein
VLEKAALARRKIVDANNDVSVVNKSIYQIAAYEAGTSSDRHRFTHLSSKLNPGASAATQHDDCENPVPL